MLHLVKLAVGVRNIAALREAQAARAAAAPPLRHRTRNMPRRAAELLDGGSLYWVMGGMITVRQRVLGITEDRWEDGTSCAGLLLDPTLVAVAARPLKPFQGWRYLEAGAAPPDLADDAAAAGAAALPEDMRRALRALCLL